MELWLRPTSGFGWEPIAVLVILLCANTECPCLGAPARLPSSTRTCFRFGWGTIAVKIDVRKKEVPCIGAPELTPAGLEIGEHQHTSLVCEERAEHLWCLLKHSTGRTLQWSGLCQKDCHSWRYLHSLDEWLGKKGEAAARRGMNSLPSQLQLSLDQTRSR